MHTPMDGCEGCIVLMLAVVCTRQMHAIAALVVLVQSNPQVKVTGYPNAPATVGVLTAVSVCEQHTVFASACSENKAEFCNLGHTFFQITTILSGVQSP